MCQSGSRSRAGVSVNTYGAAEVADILTSI